MEKIKINEFYVLIDKNKKISYHFARFFLQEELSKGNSMVIGSFNNTMTKNEFMIGLINLVETGCYIENPMAIFSLHNFVEAIEILEKEECEKLLIDLESYNYSLAYTNHIRNKIKESIKEYND